MTAIDNGHEMTRSEYAKVRWGQLVADYGVTMAEARAAYPADVLAREWVGACHAAADRDVCPPPRVLDSLARWIGEAPTLGLVRRSRQASDWVPASVRTNGTLESRPLRPGILDAAP